MSKVDKQQLRELAEKATQGDWTTDGDVTVIAAGSDQLNNGYSISECHGPESRQNTNFIAAISPATVLALLDEIKTLEDLYQMHKATEERQMIDLKAEVEALRKHAELYRALRTMHWHSSPLAVVRNPKLAIKPGHDCPSDERLDEAILEAITGGADRGR